MIAVPAHATDYNTRQVNDADGYTFDDDSFHNSNQTGERGGAIYNTSGNTLNLIRDTFSANSADWGGAIYSGGNAPLNIYGGSQFDHNIARYEGGAIYSAANVSIFGHNGGNYDYSTGVSFSNNTADGEANDIYMGGSANTHLYLNLASQVHTYHYTYPCGDDTCDGYRYYKDDITLNGGIDGEYYTINATSKTNSAGTSTVAMGDVSGATEVNIGANDSITFGKATARSIDAGDLNLYNGSSLVVDEDVYLGGSANVAANSYLEIGGDLDVDEKITNNDSTVTVNGYVYAGEDIQNTDGIIEANGDISAEISIQNTNGIIEAKNHVEDEQTVASDIKTITLTNTNGTVTATGNIYASNGNESAGNLTNLANGNIDATIEAGADIGAYAISNAKTGTGTGEATIEAGEDIRVVTDLSNTNGAVIAGGNILAWGNITNSLTSDLDDVGSIITAGGDIKAVEISNTKTGSGNGLATISADGKIYATKTVVGEETTYTGAKITNSDAFIGAEEIYATTIDNTEGSILALGDDDDNNGNIVASGAITNKATGADGATINANNSITAASLTNTKLGTGDAFVQAGEDITVAATLSNNEGLVTAGTSSKKGAISVGTTLTNTQGTVTAYGDIDVGTSITNTNGTIEAKNHVEDEETITGDIDTVVLSNSNGSISATGNISAIDYDTDSDGSLTNTGSGATITAGGFIDTVILSNTNGTIEAGGDIYASNSDGDVGSLINSGNASITAGGYIDTITLSNTNSSISATGSISAISIDEDAGSITNLRSSDDNSVNAIVTAGSYIETYALSNKNTGSGTGVASITAGSSTSEGDISVETTLENTNAIITAYGDVYAYTSITNENGTIEAKSYTESETSVAGNIETITLENTNGAVSATGDILASADDASSGSLINLRSSSADDVNATITAGGTIVTDVLSNTNTGLGNGVATITAGSPEQEGSIFVNTTLTNTNGTITAHGGIAAITSIENENGTIETKDYSGSSLDPLAGAIDTLDLTNTNGTINALGRISAINLNRDDGKIINSGVNAEITSGQTIDTVTLKNTNGSISAAEHIYAVDEDVTTGGLTNIRKDDAGAVDATVEAGGDIVTYSITNTNEGDDTGDAKITAGGSIYAAMDDTSETVTYTGLTLNNTLGIIEATGNIYAIGGSNSGKITADTLYLQGDTETPRTYGNTGLIEAAVDITDGMTLTTDGIDVIATPTKGITGAINNEGLLKVTSGTIVANVTGAGTLQVDAGNTAEINSGVTVSQNTVKTGATTGILANNGTLNVNALLDNKGEIANDGTINLNGIGVQTNDGVISGDGTLNVKTIAGTGSAPDKTTELTNNGLINSDVVVDAGSTFVTAASDDADAASATSGITGAIVNNGALIFNNGGYLTGNVTGDNGTTVISTGVNIEAVGETGITQKNIGIAGSLEIDANKIVGAVTNDGVLTLRGGVDAENAKALAQAINGNGVTQIDDGYVTSGYAINQGMILFDDAHLSISADNVKGYVSSEGVLELTGGKLSQNVNYDPATQTGANDGTVTIAGNTEFTADAIYAETVNINAGSTLIVGDKIINAENGNVDGTLDLHITSAAKDAETVAGSNVTINTLTVDNNAKLVVNIADGVLDAQHAKTHSVALIKEADNVFSADQIQIVSNGNYTIEVDDVNHKYVLINEDSYADTTAAASGSENNMNTAVAIDNAMGLENGSVGREIQKQLNLLSKSDPVAYKKALTDVAPTDSAVHTGLTQDFNNLIGAEVANRLGKGRNGGDVFEHQSAWAQVLYNHSKQDSSHDTTGFKGNTRGLAIGVDGELNKQTVIGLGYAYGRTDIDSLGRDMDISSHNIFAYGKYQPSKFYVRGMINYGRADYVEKAMITGNLNRSKYHVDNYGARAYIGYNLDYGFTPEAGLRYTYIDDYKYTDRMGQHVKSDSHDVLTGVLGVNYSKTIRRKGFKFTPKAHLDFTYDLASDNTSANVLIGDSSYEIKGKKLKRFGTEAGVAADVNVGNWDFTVGYDLGIRKDYKSHTGSLKAKYNF